MGAHQMGSREKISMFSFSKEEEVFLKSLNSPAKIQDYLDSIPFNFEKKGETCMSPRRILREEKAHCFEGALLACSALMIHGEKPLVLSLQVTDEDWPHAITLFKRNGYWGAISKTNHAVLRYRDPVYKSIRELALSYFHEYFLVSNGKKTLRGYSQLVNLRRFGTKWLTTEEDLFYMTETLRDMQHKPVVPKGQEKYLRNASEFEQRVADIPEWKK